MSSGDGLITPRLSMIDCFLNVATILLCSGKAAATTFALALFAAVSLELLCCCNCLHLGGQVLHSVRFLPLVSQICTRVEASCAQSSSLRYHAPGGVRSARCESCQAALVLPRRWLRMLSDHKHHKQCIRQAFQITSWSGGGNRKQKQGKSEDEVKHGAREERARTSTAYRPSGEGRHAFQRCEGAPDSGDALAHGVAPAIMGCRRQAGDAHASPAGRFRSLLRRPPDRVPLRGQLCWGQEGGWKHGLEVQRGCRPKFI